MGWPVKDKPVRAAIPILAFTFFLSNKLNNTDIFCILPRTPEMTEAKILWGQCYVTCRHCLTSTPWYRRLSTANSNLIDGQNDKIYLWQTYNFFCKVVNSRKNIIYKRDGSSIHPVPDCAIHKRSFPIRVSLLRDWSTAPENRT